MNINFFKKPIYSSLILFSALHLSGCLSNGESLPVIEGSDKTGTTASTPATVIIPAPTSLTLLSPDMNISDSPNIRISGVSSGEIVKLFVDSSCYTLVSTGTATGDTIDLKSSSLAEGLNHLYATTGNSACSTATTNYTRIACPTGFILVPASATLGVNDFCVMQFEAKNIAGIATSQAAALPWSNINRVTAANACLALGSNYDLISNPEWMTIAQNAENVPENWWGTTVGSGMMPRGHCDDVPAGTIAVTNINDPYSGTNNSSTQPKAGGWEQRRTLILSNGNTIWDLTGNISEWIDWTMDPGLQPAPACSTQYDWQEFPNLNCASMAAADYLPTHVAYDHFRGVGQILGGSGDAPMRGGGIYYGTTVPGVFTLNLANSVDYMGLDVGFRCVYRP